MIYVVAVEQSALQSKLAGYPKKLAESVLRAITRLSIEAQASVKESKLSGQVLHVRTGTLRRSINREVKAQGSKISAVVGTNVEYAGAHEFGFTGAVTVKAHVRRSKKQLKAALRTRKDGTTYYTRTGMRSGEVQVSSHTRNMRVPERSFLRSTLKEFEGKIQSGVADAARNVW